MTKKKFAPSDNIVYMKLLHDAPPRCSLPESSFTCTNSGGQVAYFWTGLYFAQDREICRGWVVLATNTKGKMEARREATWSRWPQENFQEYAVMVVVISLPAATHPRRQGP